MKIAKKITELIGSTPLLDLEKYRKEQHLEARILAKLEFFNPGGSIKDRVALAMLDDAEKRGLITPGATIIEPTSGNTGVGLAMVGAARGYKIILTMPETMSVERQNLLRAFGAKIVLTDGAKAMSGAIAKAHELKAAIANSFIPSQFDNPANPLAHEKTTGSEIWEDTNGNIDILVAGVGSGGTVSGVGAYLKSKNSSVQVVGVEPAASPILSAGKAGAHRIQGIGANFVPENFKKEVVDEIITVSDEDAYAACKTIVRCEGTLVGISSGAALHAGLVLARRKENKEKTIVVIFPDTGERYFSTGVFDD